MADSSNPFFISPPNVLQALMLGKEAYGEAQGTAARRAAEEALLQGKSNDALARLIGGGDPKLVNALAQHQQATQGAYGNVIYGVGPNNETLIGTTRKDGSFQPINTGSFTPTLPVQQVQGPTGTQLIPGRAPIVGGVPQVGGGAAVPAAAPGQAPQAAVPSISGGFIPKDVAGAARLKQEGENVAGMGQAKSAVDNSIAQLDRLGQDAIKIRDNPSLSRVTGWMGAMPSFPNSKARDVEADIKTLGSKSAYAVLQNMREMSKTGGAVGQVSNYETQLLQNNIAAMDQLQSTGKFKESMDMFVDYVEGAKKRLRAAYEQDYGRLQQPSQQQGQQPSQTTPSGRPDEIKVIGGKRYFRYGDQWVIP